LLRIIGVGAIVYVILYLFFLVVPEIGLQTV